MRTDSVHRLAIFRTRGWVAAALVALLALACSLALATASAPAQDLDAKLDESRQELDRVQSDQSALAAQVEAQNAEIDAALGEVSALQAQEDEVEARLSAKQAELDRTVAALELQRAHLVVVRKRLVRGLDVLGDRLVEIYISGDPNEISVIFATSDWSEALATSEYLNQIQDYDDALVGRVRALRELTEATVARLADAERKIESARDAIAAQEEELAGARAAAQSRYAELEALRAEREQTLAALAAEEEGLRGDISSIAGQIERQEAAAAEAAGEIIPLEDPGPAPAPPSGSSATLGSDGLAIAPADAPPAVVAAIDAANSIADTPYLWGGGHGSFESSGYDCSGAVSFALHAGGFLDTPLDSTGLAFWGESGYGSWITVYANSGHVYVVIAGLRFDTSGGAGPRWHPDERSSAGFVPRHPSGY